MALESLDDPTGNLGSLGIEHRAVVRDQLQLGHGVQHQPMGLRAVTPMTVPPTRISVVNTTPDVTTFQEDSSTPG